MLFFQAIEGVFAFPQLTVAIWGMVSSFVFCLLLVLTKQWHGVYTIDSSIGIQKFHTLPTPRIGGVPIVLGLIVAWGKAPEEVKQLLTPILIAGLPAFLFGVAEDLTKRVSVLQRLLATMASGLLAWWITDYSLTRLDIWGLDWLLSFTMISVIFTVFAVGGVANSINIIDGFNGLAGIISTLAFIGYALIAWQVGDITLASTSLVLAASILGFFWVNWPMGKIFLGDGGSYFIGFSLAWVAVMLIERNSGVSAFAALLVCVHPVTEVLFSIYRRRTKQANLGHPDRLHFHSLVRQRYVRRWFSRLSCDARNSVTGLLVGSLSFASVVVACLVYGHPALSFAGCILTALGYVALYARMVRYHWCSPFKFLFVSPSRTGSQSNN